MSRVARHVVVHGLVQGVFFRDSTRRIAAAQGVCGWVRNRPDGALEAVLEGDPASVDRVMDFMSAGPEGARVDRVVRSSVKPRGLDQFRIEG